MFLNRPSTPDARYSAIDAALLTNIKAWLASPGMSGPVVNIDVLDPMCMAITEPVSSHAARNGSH